MPVSSKKKLIVLISIGTLLLLAASCTLFFLWWDGQRAQQAAGDLLEEVSSQPEEEPEEDAKITYVLGVPSIGLTLPVIWDYSMENLQTSVCRFSGPEPGQDGHLVITGHDYLSGAHFGKLDQVAVGDSITLMGRDETAFRYTVSEILTVKPDDVAALDAFAEGHTLTLMTCSDNANSRLLVRCSPAA